VRCPDASPTTSHGGTGRGPATVPDQGTDGAKPGKQRAQGVAPQHSPAMNLLRTSSSEMMTAKNDGKKRTCDADKRWGPSRDRVSSGISPSLPPDGLPFRSAHGHEPGPRAARRTVTSPWGGGRRQRSQAAWSSVAASRRRPATGPGWGEKGTGGGRGGRPHARARVRMVCGCAAATATSLYSNRRWGLAEQLSFFYNTLPPLQLWNRWCGGLPVG